MSVTLALAGDTMLGRGVAEQLGKVEPEDLVAEEVREVTAAADLFVLNLECCISEGGEQWPDPGKPFFFRAPPLAVGMLVSLGVDCVTLANNHALDFGFEAMLDTRTHLAGAGIHCVGVGADEAEARAPAVLQAGELRMAVFGVTDHPADFAAGPAVPGVAYADLRTGVPDWLRGNVNAVRRHVHPRVDQPVDAVLVTPHWGPNMTPEPVPHVRSAARELVQAGATLVAGHSAHIFHAMTGRVLYDLGGFIDDYAVHPTLRNDLGILVLLTIEGDGSISAMEAVPLALDFCYTRLARGEEYTWVRDRLAEACAAWGSEVAERGDRLVVG